MKHLIGTLGCAMVLVLVVPTLGAAQARPASGTAQARPAAAAPAGAAKNIWAGVYTEAQAKRGETIRERECAMCHAAAEWSRPAFLASFYGRSANDLFLQIKSTMPMDGPGRLTNQEYADILAYMMKLHGAPAGQAELKGEEASLRAVTIQRKQ